MKNKTAKNVRNKAYLLPIIAILVVFYSYILIANDGSLIFYGDSYEQVLQFYAGMWTKFHNGNIGFWDWSLGFGANSFTSTYYCNLNNVYFYITLLFPKRFLPQLLTLFQLLKFILIYIASYHWLKELKRSDLSSIIGALIITFSGWVMSVFNYNIFLDTYPLYFLSLFLFEKYLTNNKVYPLVLSLALTIITNFYNGYMFLPFLLAYSLFRYYLINRKITLKETLNFIGKIILLIMIAVAISAIVLLPSINVVLKTPRLDEITSFRIINMSTLYRFVSSIFIPVSYKLNPNLFINLNAYNGIGWSGGTSLFSLIVSVVVLPLLFTINNKKEKKALISFFSLFLIVMCIPTLYRLFHGVEETRWFFMFSIIVAITVSSIIDKIFNNEISKKQILISYTISTLIFIMILLISVIKKWYFDKSDLFLFVVSYFILSSLYTCIIIKKSKIILVTILTVEILFNMINYIRFDSPKPFANINIDKYTSVVNHLKNIDDGYYRLYFSENSRDVANKPTAYNFLASSFYSSLYNYEQRDYLKRYTGSWLSNQNDGRIYNYNLEGYKYWIGYYDEIPPYGFEYINTFDNYVIYQNKYYIGLGYMNNELLSTKSIEHLPYFKQDQLLQKYLFVSESENEYQISMLDKHVTQIAEYVPHSYFEYELSNNEQGTMIFVENFAMENVYVEFYNNNELVLHDYSVQQNYVGVYCPPKLSFDKIVVYVNDIYGYNSGINIYHLQNFDSFESVYGKNSQNLLYNVNVNGDNVTAEIDVKSEMASGLLFTSIAYDSGWKAYVDGVESDIVKVNLGFVGLKLTPGHHEIEFRYMSPYFIEGCFVSLAGIITLVIIEYRHYKRKDMSDKI